MSRIAPDGGYNFEAKARFRKFVWQSIASRSPWREKGQQVALMPSSEGAEIETALAAGFLESNIHAIDRNAAIVATLKRKYPSLNTYGCSIGRAHSRIGNAGVRLYGDSIDLCSNGNWRTALMLAWCSGTDCWQTGARIVVNVLRGREDALTRQMLLGDSIRTPWQRHIATCWSEDSECRPTVHDAWRIAVLCLALPLHVAHVLRARAYVSSNGQSFLTIVFKMTRAVDAKNQEAFWNRLKVTDIVRALTTNSVSTGKASPRLPDWAYEFVKVRVGVLTGAIRGDALTYFIDEMRNWPELRL